MTVRETSPNVTGRESTRPASGSRSRILQHEIVLEAVCPNRQVVATGFEDLSCAVSWRYPLRLSGALASPPPLSGTAVPTSIDNHSSSPLGTARDCQMTYYWLTSSANPLKIRVTLTRRRNVSSLNPVWTRSPMKMPANVIGSVIANNSKTSRVKPPIAR